MLYVEYCKLDVGWITSDSLAIGRILAFLPQKLDSSNVPGEQIDNKTLTFPIERSQGSHFAAKLRYWWCWAVAGAMLIVIGVPAMFFFWLLRRKTWLYPLARFGARMWLKACGATVKVRGLDHLEAGKQYVFASNHRSYLDTATLFAFAGTRIGLVAKKELLKVPVLGQGMGFVNVIAIDRSNAERARQSMEKAREAMQDGYSFGVFVEGTRAMPGELLPFKKGAFHLAVQTKAPVIPVAIKDTDRMMPKRGGVAYSGEIELVLLPPISTDGKTTDDVMELLLATRSRIAGELKKKN
jgi:1-acyl-sn-glycerol-3-phosphate acyltransferase